MKFIIFSVFVLIICLQLDQTVTTRRFPAAVKSISSCSDLFEEFVEAKTKKVTHSKVHAEISGRLIKNNVSTPSLRGFNHERAKQIEKLFSEQNIMISTTQHESMRKFIVDTGAEKSGQRGFQFKNTWETRTTNTDTPNGVLRRLNETYRLGISIDEFKDISPEELPVYAYMHFKTGLTPKQKGFLHPEDFGEDIWTFKKDSVMPNATFTIGDSFSDKGEVFNLLDDTIIAPADFIFRVPDNISPNPMKDLDTLFLPYSDYKNVLMKHYLEQWDGDSLRGQTLLQRKNISKPNYNWDDPTARLKNELDLEDLNFIEIQLYKSSKGEGLDLDSIESFTFTETPPSKKLMAIFKEKKIEVFDWRVKTDDPIPYSAAKTGKIAAMENSEKNRIADVEELIYKNLTPKEKDAVLKAHSHGLKKGQLPENKKYTDREINKIKKILKEEGGFKGDQLEMLLDDYLD